MSSVLFDLGFVQIKWYSFFILVAVIIYVLVVVILKIFTKEELKMLPAGDKIVKILEKIKIY